MFSREVIIEGVKEMLRVVAIAIVPVLISNLEQGKIDYRQIFVVGAIALLRFVDKVLHLAGVETDNESLTKGLTRF